MSEGRELTPREARFVDEYLIDLNAGKAAIRAGYTPNHARQIGYQLLQREVVQDAVADAMERRSQRTEIKQDRVLKEIAKIAYSNMKDFARWNESGITYLPSDEIDQDNAACIYEVSEHTNQHASTLRIKLHDKVRALELLGKHLGIFDERPDDEEVEEYKRPESMRKES